MINIVLYHSMCNDGTAAAAAFLAKPLPGTTILEPIRYGEHNAESFHAEGGPMDRIMKKTTDFYGMKGVDMTFFFVDFAPKRDLLEELAATDKVVIYDHHKTALEDLSDLIDGATLPNAEIVFDMHKSGAQLAWENIVGKVPDLIAHVADRDLWTWKMDRTRDVMAWLAIAGELNDPQSYLDAIALFDTQRPACLATGQALMALQTREVKMQASKARRWNIYDLPEGLLVPATCFASEVCEAVYEKHDYPWVCGFSFTKDGKVALSFRSKQERSSSSDVSKIARMFGGGGHRHAAGGVMEVDEFLELYKLSSKL